MENPVPRLSVVSITTTDFLYNLISSWVDNFADVIKKSIAGIENVCGNRANTLKAIAIAMSQKAHLGNGRLVFGFSFRDRKSTRLNSSHVAISYAVFCF